LHGELVRDGVGIRDCGFHETVYQVATLGKHQSAPCRESLVAASQRAFDFGPIVQRALKNNAPVDRGDRLEPLRHDG
jgi:hypothetical protein